MKKYIYLLFVALFATTSFAFVGCSSDDDEIDDSVNEESAFVYNGEKLYVRDTGAFNNLKLDNMMQMEFSLYKTSEPYNSERGIGIYPKVGVTLEIEPFDVNTAAKGAKLDVVTSRYTWIEDFSNGFHVGEANVSGVEYYFKPTSGEVTFEGYDSSNNTVTIRVNLTMANPSKSVTLKGTVACEYEDDSYVSSSFGGDYPY